MSLDLKKIKDSLDQITATLKRQSDDLQYLREQIRHIVQVTTPKAVSVVIDPECGYEWIGAHILLDADTWSRIKAGEHIAVKGNGWVPNENVVPDPADELFHWDHWEFKGGIGKPMKLTMLSTNEEYMDLDDTVAFEGPLLSRYVHEQKPI